MSAFSNKTVLITGATGLMGSHIASFLLKENNVKIAALSRNKEKLERIYKEYIKAGRVKIIAQDASKPINDDIGCIDYIFHAASPISGAVIKESPVDVIEPNVLGTKYLLDFLKNQAQKTGKKGRLILFSSATVYANNTSENITVKEDETSIADSLDAVNSPYSESKRFIEVLAKAYSRQYGIETIIARFSYIYGPVPYMPNTAFYEFINKAERGEDITLNNSDIARRDNIYVEDAVRGVVLIAEKGISGESYNVSSNGDLGNFKAVDEMAQIISHQINETLNFKTQVKYLSEKSENRKPGICMDNNKLKQLGWNIEYSIEHGIKETINYYLNN